MDAMVQIGTQVQATALPFKFLEVSGLKNIEDKGVARHLQTRFGLMRARMGQVSLYMDHHRGR